MSQKDWLNYHHLFYFMTIASEESVAKAAKKLRLGQSTLSTQLGQFEAHLGMKLFERRQKRLHLSEAGKIALQYAREIFRLGDELLDTLGDRLTEARLSMQVGALDTIPKGVVASLIAAAQEFQACSVSVIEGHADQLLRSLRAHEIDLAVFNYQPVTLERKGLSTKMVGRSPVAVVATKNFHRLQRGFPDSLSNQPFLMPGPESRLRYDIESCLRGRNIAVNMVMEGQDLSLLTLLAAKDHGVMAVSDAIVPELSERYGLVSLGNLPDVYDEVWLLAGQRRFENPVASDLFRRFSLR